MDKLPRFGCLRSEIVKGTEIASGESIEIPHGDDDSSATINDFFDSSVTREVVYYFFFFLDNCEYHFTNGRVHVLLDKPLGLTRYSRGIQPITILRGI